MIKKIIAAIIVAIPIIGFIVLVAVDPFTRAVFTGLFLTVSIPLIFAWAINTLID